MASTAARTTLVVLFLSSFLGVVADVSFTPGPGLKKNDDGTYSRTYDAKAEGAAADRGGGGDGALPPWQNLALSVFVVAAVYCYSSGSLPSLPSMPKREPRAPPPASESDVAEARAARLARFTGAGPARNEAAFAEALDGAGPASPAAARAPAAPAAPVARVATLGSVLARDGDKEDEFFGGDSTSTYK